MSLLTTFQNIRFRFQSKKVDQLEAADRKTSQASCSHKTSVLSHNTSERQQAFTGHALKTPLW